MTPTAIEIRRLTAGDGAHYRGIRLEALRTAPEAFASTYEHEASRTLDQFEKRVVDGCIFAAFASSGIVGVAGFYRQSGPRFEHKGVLWGMYVSPEHRNAGVGAALVTAILKHAVGVVDLITLSVVTSNQPAISLYEKLGFRSYGIEPRALKLGAAYFSENLMMRDLT